MISYWYCNNIQKDQFYLMETLKGTEAMEARQGHGSRRICNKY
jgi:hypothetical protein